MPPALDDDAIAELPPEMPGGLTFHLPMELAALRDAGAPAEVVQARTADRLAEAWRAGLVDPPLYRWAVERYAATAVDLVHGDDARRAAALVDVAPLAEGLAGAAFHGLIRLGYGVWRRDEAEVARGLAYLRTRRQVLASPDAAHAAPLDAVRRDLPTPDERDGVTVFDLLNLVAGTQACTNPERRATAPRALAVAAAALVRRNPSSFVAVHAMTGLHALCELHALVAGDDGLEHEVPALALWWRHLGVAVGACTLLVESGSPEAVAAYDGAHGAIDDVDALVLASVHSAETHDVKLAVALRRVVRFGLLSDAEACEVGSARLGAAVLAPT